MKFTVFSVYHPASNGLAENAVQIVKIGLFAYLFVCLPQKTNTAWSFSCPNILGRRPQSRLDILRPLTAEKVDNQQFY